MFCKQISAVSTMCFSQHQELSLDCSIWSNGPRKAALPPRQGAHACPGCFGALGSWWNLSKRLKEVILEFYIVRSLQFVSWLHNIQMLLEWWDIRINQFLNDPERYKRYKNEKYCIDVHYTGAVIKKKLRIGSHPFECMFTLQIHPIWTKSEKASSPGGGGVALSF